MISLIGGMKLEKLCIKKNVLIQVPVNIFGAGKLPLLLVYWHKCHNLNHKLNLLNTKKGFPDIREAFLYRIEIEYYIIPPIPPPPIGGMWPPFSSSGSSAKTTSVVNNIAAIDAAFSNAIRPTLVGSITPALIRFS